MSQYKNDVRSYFWSEKYRSRIFPFQVINFDDNINEKGDLEENSRQLDGNLGKFLPNLNVIRCNAVGKVSKIFKLKQLSYSTFLMIVCLYTLYYIVIERGFGKIESITVVSLAVITSFIPIYCNNYLTIKSTFGNALNLFEMLDGMLIRFKTFKKHGRFIHYIIHNCNFVCLLISHTFLFCLVFYVINPGTRMYAAEMLLLSAVSHYAFYLMIMRLLLYDRLTITNAFLKEMINNGYKPDYCHLCRATSDERYFCYVHIFK